MIEAISIVLLIVFCSLNAFSLIDFLVRRSNLTDDLGAVRQQLAQLEAKLSAARAELEDLEFDIELLETEQQAVQAQEACMQELERAQARNDEAPRRG